MNTATTWPTKIWIAILLSCLPSIGSLAAQEPPSAAASLRVGVSPVFPPMVFKQGKELAGVEVDLARALGEKLGRKVIFVELPWEDQIISDSTLVWHLAGLHAADGLTAVPLALSEEQLAWGIRKGDEKLLAAANEFIQKASQDGTLNRIFHRWAAVAP